MPSIPPRPSMPPPPGDDLADHGGPLAQAGTLLGAAGFVGLVTALPSSLRGPDAEGSWLWAFLAAAGALAVPALALVATMRGARRGLQAFGGERARLRLVGFLSWVCMLHVFVLFFAAILRRTTHHHGLAGATFAVISVFVAAGSLLAARRLSRALAGGPPSALVPAILGLVLAAVLLTFVLLTKSARVAAGPVLLDLSVLVVAAFFASQRSFAASKGLAVVGPALFAALIVVVAKDTRGARALPASAAARAPSVAWFFEVVGPPLTPENPSLSSTVPPP